MIKDFKTYGEAFDICKEYFLDDLCPPISPFRLAEALKQAYKDGTKEHSIEADAKKSCDCEHPYEDDDLPGCPKCNPYRTIRTA